MSAWGLATAALLLCYRVASLRLACAHAHKHARTHLCTKCFSLFSSWGRKVAFKLSQGRSWGCISGFRRSALVVDAVGMTSKQILSWWNFVLLPRNGRWVPMCVCVTMLVCVCVCMCWMGLKKKKKMPPRIYNMFLGGGSPAGARQTPYSSPFQLNVHGKKHCWHVQSHYSAFKYNSP